MLEQETIIKELQALASLYQTNFSAIQAELQTQANREQKRHESLMEALKQLETMQAAVVGLVGNLDRIMEQLQEVTLAWINMLEQEEQKKEPDNRIAV